MAKVSFTSLKLKNIEEKVIIEELGIEVYKTLPYSEKMKLIEEAVECGIEEGGFINTHKTNRKFFLGVVYHYTNINFTETQLKNEEKLYDLLEQNHIFDKINAVLDNKEVEQLNSMYITYLQDKRDYNKSFAAALDSVLSTINSNGEEAKQILESFKPEDYPEVLNFLNAIK